MLAIITEFSAHLYAGIVAEQTLNFCPLVHVSLPKLSSLIKTSDYVDLIGMIRPDVFPDYVTTPSPWYSVLAKGTTHSAPFRIVHSLVKKIEINWPFQK